MTTEIQKPTRRTKRRGNGEGSIYQRPDGRWSAILSLGRDGNGKRIRRTIYAWTKKEVQDELAKMQSSNLAGTLAAPSRTTVAQFVERWLEDVARMSISWGTYVNYRGAFDNHISPRIGGVALQKLTPAQVQSIYAEMERAGSGAGARRMAHCVLHRALKYATKTGLVVRNVCELVESPKVRRRRMTTLDADQANRLLVAIAGDRLEGLYWVAITCGLRLGELFGLQWQDIDLKAGTLSVCHSQSEVNGRMALNEPKTASGRRKVSLPPETVAALVRHQSRMLAEGNIGAQRVFCDLCGGPLRRPNFTRRSFKPLLKRAGLADMRFHDLRHTMATLMLTLGVHPKIVQERLGHANISMTLDTYSHVLPGMQADAAAQIGVMFRQSAENGRKVAVQAG